MAILILNHSFLFKFKPTTTTTTAIPFPHSPLPHRRRHLSASASASASSPPSPAPTPPPVVRKRTRYRKMYPGESEGITAEMRFVAMRLRNAYGKGISDAGDADGDGDTWQPSTEGFLSYLVDSEVVFNAVERIVDDSNDVAYAYFRNTGLERSESLSKDLEFFRNEGLVIPEPTSQGVSYGKYLEQLSEKSAPLFLCHFYNIYFSHIAGGRVIGKQVSEALFDGMELEFYKWDGDVQELLQGVREKLNMLGEPWSRYEKNRCLREAAKSFKLLGQIVRLIIL